MKNKAAYIFGFISLILLGGIVWFMSIALKADYSSDIPQEKACEPAAEFNLSTHLSEWDSANYLESFPYQVYLDSSDKCDIHSILDYLRVMDSTNPNNQSVNRHIISIALTDSLQARIKSSFNSYHPDSLIIMVQWAEKFNHYKDYDKPNAKLYRVIYKHWINFVANKLRTYYDSLPRHKYDFKFNYLTAICQSKNLSPPIGNSDFEKVIFNLINKNYSYLFSKLWYDTSLLYKLLVLIIAVITAYGYYCIVKIHFKRKSV